VAAATFIVIGVFSDQAALYAPVYKISLHALDILGNTLLFPFEFYQSKFRLIPPAWSLGVEILAYFLLWLFISRGKRQSIITLAISLVYVAYTFIAGLKGVDRYFPLYAALLPFSVGALIYHYLTEIKNALVKLPRYATPFSILALLAHLVLAGKISKYPLGAGLYVNLALMAFIIAQLAVVQNAAGFIKKMDIFLGNLSYPVFLTHSLAGFITSLIFPSYAQFDFPIVLMIGYPLAIVLSIFIGKYIDEPINVWRDKFRKSP
jgi:peptidoglycan/LPS O-acetylase OafA/YrhL